MAALEVTDWARDILRKSQAAALRFNREARIRLVRSGDGAEPRLVDEPYPDDEAVDIGGVVLYVERGLSGLLDVEEPHDRLVLRPAGSAPNPRHPG